MCKWGSSFIIKNSDDDRVWDDTTENKLILLALCHLLASSHDKPRREGRLHRILSPLLGGAGVRTCCYFPLRSTHARRCQRTRFVERFYLPNWKIWFFLPPRLASNFSLPRLLVFVSGIFFILPCIDAYARVDLRTRTYDVPPQELSIVRSQTERH